MINNDWPWHIKQLPFYYGPLSTLSTEENIPDFLPFTLEVEADTGLFVQKYNETIDDALHNAYKIGLMVGGNMEDNGIGQEYTNSFLDFVKKIYKNNLVDTKILEIGCGTGYLLYRLQQLGANVLGIEPGEHGQAGSQKYNIPIIQDFFPSEKIVGRFDCIIMNNVLEHMPNYRQFLRQTATYLQKDGKLIITVPNCVQYIKSGDVSMLFHEHYSYFTKNSLQLAVAKAINRSLYVEEASFGGLLYSITEDCHEGNLLSNTAGIAMNYRQLAERVTLPKLKQYFAKNQDKEIGVFVPARAINFLTLCRDEFDLGKVRFFDDDINLYHKYFPGFPNRVESRIELCQNPPSRILIMSFSFGEKIKNSLREILSTDIALDTIQELLIQK